MKQLKQIVISLLMAGLLFFISCTDHTDINKTNSVFYLVQPAEHYAAFNGHLSWYGRLRAGDLMRFLKDSGIQKIYVTPFSRSVETVDSLKLLQRIDTVEYVTDSSGASVLTLLKQRADFGKKVLIVARPYVIPDIIRKLGVDFSGNKFPEHGFNLIYEVVNHHGKATLKQHTFGNIPRPVTADTAGQEHGL